MKIPTYQKVFEIVGTLFPKFKIKKNRITLGPGLTHLPPREYRDNGGEDSGNYFIGPNLFVVLTKRQRTQIGFGWLDNRTFFLILENFNSNIFFKIFGTKKQTILSLVTVCALQLLLHWLLIGRATAPENNQSISNNDWYVLN